jgi:hypothetical protein
MHTPESIEATLSRLMPPALSASGQQAIEEMLDDLAAAAPAARLRIPRRVRFALPAGIAAALVIGFGLFPGQRPAALPLAVNQDPPAAADYADSGLVLISATDQVEDIADEGWLGTPDGETIQAVRCRMVEASRFLDEETGIEVVVSEPREEVVLTPVSIF